jgi:hypothetical protein
MFLVGPKIFSFVVKGVKVSGGHFENGDQWKFFDVRNQFGHHNLPTYEMSLKSDNVEFVRHCGGTSKNFYQSPFSKWLPQYCKNSTLFDFKGNF